MIGRRRATLAAGALAAMLVASGGAAALAETAPAAAPQTDASGRPMATSSASRVVVELFTAQGCSACPPADNLLEQLTTHDDILPLALHVDYWDYLGWKDSLAKPAFTARQKGYAHANGKRMIYTPQMVVNGVDFVKGTQPMEVADLVSRMRQRAPQFTLSVVNEGAGRYKLVALPVAGADSAPMVLELVHFTPEQTVSIKHGENAGQKVDYVNIVRSWEELGKWDGSGELDLTFTTSDGTPGAILLQHDDYGRIEAAVRLPLADKD